MPKKGHGTTAGGVPLTEHEIAELAKRAEQGYDVDQTLRRRRGRQPMESASEPVESAGLEPELRAAQTTLTKVTENSYAEQPALEWLQYVGWSYASGTRLAPDLAAHERSIARDVVLRETLTLSIARLNPDLPTDEVTRVAELTMAGSHPEVVRDHQDFHRLLLEGVPISWLDGHGVERSGRATLVDFEDPARNEFIAVNQLTIEGGGKVVRRPDVLLYVNGLPLAQIELKNPAGHAGPREAANQVAHYRDTIPDLYRYVEVIGVSDLLRARVGTITTGPSHFAEWKTMDPAGMRGRTQLEVLIREVFTPVGLLDLVRNFVLFESDGARTWKVLAKYHQVDAVNRAVNATAGAMAGDGRAGVVWHTQGAGKSYSMVFYVTKLRRDRRFENPTVVCVTDTNDLDNQLSETFARQTDLHDAVTQAHSISNGEDSLYALLDVPAGGIVFTTIQKFGRGRDEPEMPVISDRHNVVVIADEAHRSQYDTLAQNLMRALPNATRIGFTGTPIESVDKSTRTTFGDYISVYRMAQAQADGATVPIYYESRQVPVDIDRTELESVQAELDEESEEAQTELSSEFARIDRIVGAPDRLDRIVDDLVGHFTDRCRTLPGKAMVVAYSKRLAAEYATRLKARLGEDAVDAVMSAGAQDDPQVSHYRKSRQQLKEAEKRFKDPASALRVMVVKNMWLTGFDAPVLHTLYIDKPMRDHGLLQAIARVNRVFEDKPGGLVVDYIGIGDDLRAGLKAYAQGDVDDVVVPLEVAQRKLAEQLEVMRDLLHGIDWTPPEGATAGQASTALHKASVDAVARFALDDDAAGEYLHQQAVYSRWFRLVSPNEPSRRQRYDHDFFAIVAKALRLAREDEAEGSGAAPTEEGRRAVEQLFSDGLAGGEIVDVFAIAGENRPELSVLSDEFLDQIGTKVERPELQIALLRKLLAGEIATRLASNTTQQKVFSDELRAALYRYTASQLTSAQAIRELVELAKRLRAQHDRNASLGLSSEEIAFYDALIGHAEDVTADADVRALVAQIVPRVREALAVDWADRGNLTSKVRLAIKRVLRAQQNTAIVEKLQAREGRSIGGGARNGMDPLVDRLFEQARILYRRWPEVEGEGIAGAGQRIGR